MVTSVILIIVGFILLIVGADMLVDGSSSIAKKLHIPEIIIGLTIVSIGTSMPELFVSITSALDNHSDMAIGNVLGSNLCNFLLILGLSSMIKPVKFQRETRLIEIPICFIITIIFAIFSNVGGNITRIEAIILMVLFIVFICYTIFMGIKGEKFDSKDEDFKEQLEKPAKKKFSMLKNIVYIILGVAGLKVGGTLTVDNAVVVAQNFNISEKIISLTILAVGTSLPELVTSVTAAIKGNSDIAIGNIIGSNIFNMLLILGVSAVISPITYNYSYNLELAILLIATITLALFPIIPPKNKMSRVNGTIFFAMYLAYLGIVTCF
ncbi:MAG: calcium/sodium antiporter [Clostridiales bacterium]|nr:calcium/sodium antiporter [Clostridiales bacterium]